MKNETPAIVLASPEFNSFWSPCYSYEYVSLIFVVRNRISALVDDFGVIISDEHSQFVICKQYALSIVVVHICILYNFVKLRTFGLLVNKLYYYYYAYMGI